MREWKGVGKVRGRAKDGESRVDFYGVSLGLLFDMSLIVFLLPSDLDQMDRSWACYGFAKT